MIIDVMFCRDLTNPNGRSKCVGSIHVDIHPDLVFDAGADPLSVELLKCLGDHVFGSLATGAGPQSSIWFKKRD